MMLPKQVPKQDKLCPQCGGIVKRKDSTFCSFECYKDSKRPPKRECNNCGKLLIRKEEESNTTFKARRYCDKKCAAAIYKLKARKERFKKLQRPRCTVNGCREPVGDNLKYLCQNHFENASDVAENPIQLTHKERGGNYRQWINKIRKKLAERVLVFTCAEYKQDELEFYLMTKTERREARENYERQHQSTR